MKELQTAGYRRDIDGLRAIAVLAVMSFHVAPQLFPGGFVGVDIFFVISGFLISGILIGDLENGRFSLARFYSRRIKRIFPALLLVLAVCYAVGWCFLLTDEFKQLGKHIAGGAGFISNLLYWRDAGYFDGAAARKPLLHLWSLGIEEQFYIVWPLLLYTAFKSKVKLLKVMLLVGGISFFINLVMMSRDHVGLYYSPITRFWELALGCVLACLTFYKVDLTSAAGLSLKASQRVALRDLASWTGCALLIAATLFINESRVFPGWWALLPTLGAYLIISAGPTAAFNRLILSRAVLVWIGLISYPLYLWHWPMLSFLRIVAPDLAGSPWRLLVIPASILLSWGTFRLIEHPIRRGSYARVKVAILLVLMSVMGGIGYETYRHDGLEFRYPKLIAELIKTKFDLTTEWREHKCSLEPSVDKHGFSDECVDRDGKPLIVLWGDSHAAALYPGLKALQNEYNFGIGQLTTSGCPPLLSYVAENPEDKKCVEINHESLSTIRRVKPAVVLLHANWPYYRDAVSSAAAPRYPVNHDFDLMRIAETVAELRKIGVPRILLVGPVPQWRDSLQETIVAVWKKDNLHRLPPVRMRYGLRENVPAAEVFLRRTAKDLKIDYISALDAMCDSEGCITRGGRDGLDIVAFDYGHLSPTGSRILMKAVADTLIPRSSAAASR